MTRYHATADGPIAFTTQEEIDRDAEEAATITENIIAANKAIGNTAYKALIRRRAAKLPALEAHNLLKTIGE